MKWARIVDNVAVEVTDIDPTGRFHPSLMWTEVPDEVTQNSKLVDGQWEIAPVPTKPEPVEPEPEPVKLSPVEFKLLFTSQERLAIKTARETDPVIDDFMSIIDDPRLTSVRMNLSTVVEGVNYLATQGIIDPSRVDTILAGNVS